MSSLADVRGRGLLTDLVYGTLRHQLLIDASLEPRLAAPAKLHPDVRNALRLGCYELLIRKTPVHAAVDEWVEVTKSITPRLAGLANAVLRRVEIPAKLPRSVRYSLPEWLDRRFEELLGEAASEAALGMLEGEPLWLTTFLGRGGGDVAGVTSRATLALIEEGCEARPGPLAGSLSVRCPMPLGRLRAFREGLVQPQNPASRLPVCALDAQPGERVLDLASGNGIKSAELASQGAAVVSLEIDPKKVERAGTNLRRLGLTTQHLVADLRLTPNVAPAVKVLLDAPCSGTGTLRGNPEIKLRLAPNDVAGLARLQREMLDTAAALTAPGGTLVYSVCALTMEEGPGQAEWFLERHPEFEAQPVDLPLEAPYKVKGAGDGVVVVPSDGLDGFFILRLRRRVD